MLSLVSLVGTTRLIWWACEGRALALPWIRSECFADTLNFFFYFNLFFSTVPVVTPVLLRRHPFCWSTRAVNLSTELGEQLRFTRTPPDCNETMGTLCCSAWVLCCTFLQIPARTPMRCDFASAKDKAGSRQTSFLSSFLTR